MSDIVITHGANERTRTWTSIAIALGLHAAIIAVLAFAVDWGTQASRTEPITIDVQVSSPPAAELAALASAAQDALCSGFLRRPGGGLRGEGHRAVALSSRPRRASRRPRRLLRDLRSRKRGAGRASPPPCRPSRARPQLPLFLLFRRGRARARALRLDRAPPPVTQRSGTAVAVNRTASTGSLDLSQVDKALAGRTAGQARYHGCRKPRRA